MADNSWIKERRIEVGIHTQESFTERLQAEGFWISRAAVSGWEVGRNRMPIEDGRFLSALSRVLVISESEILRRSGYVIEKRFATEEAEAAASIIDGLPDETRRLALNMLVELSKWQEVYK